MPIVYDKLLEKLKEKGITSYTIRKTKVIGQGTISRIKSGGGIDIRTLEKLCEILDCQPGDLLEYVPEDKGQ